VTTPDTVGRALTVTLNGFHGDVVHAEARLHRDNQPSHSYDAWQPVKERLRAAIRNSDVAWPDARVELGLSSKRLPLPECDVAVACAVLAATGAARAERLADVVLVGELSLDGHLRSKRGVLAALRVAREAGYRRAIVPRETPIEELTLPGMVVFCAERLADVVAWLNGADGHLTAPAVVEASTVDPMWDLADVVGQPEARWALEVAATGGHHMLMTGLPSAGALLLARCLPSVLPQLSEEHAVDVASIHSMIGARKPRSVLERMPPFVDAHFSTSMPALVGGSVAPGTISRAHHGVLYLGDACEFPARELESLHWPLDEGEVRVARGDGVVIQYPTRFQLVLSTPPCPCRAHDRECTCSPVARRRFLARLCGPLLDRIDLRVRLRAPGGRKRSTEGSAAVRARVEAARARAARRWGEAHTNATVPEDLLRKVVPLPHAVTTELDNQVRFGALTERAATRTLRVAWTLAHLRGFDVPGSVELVEALAFRDRRPTKQVHS
jgi:magnesium chelatase family protein